MMDECSEQTLAFLAAARGFAPQRAAAIRSAHPLAPHWRLSLDDAAAFDLAERLDDAARKGCPQWLRDDLENAPLPAGCAYYISRRVAAELARIDARDPHRARLAQIAPRHRRPLFEDTGVQICAAILRLVPARTARPWLIREGRWLTTRVARVWRSSAAQLATQRGSRHRNALPASPAEGQGRDLARRLGCQLLREWIDDDGLDSLVGLWLFPEPVDKCAKRPLLSTLGVEESRELLARALSKADTDCQGENTSFHESPAPAAAEFNRAALP